MVEYEKDSYANIGKICKYLGNTVSGTILQYDVLIGYDATSFFCINRQHNPFKEVLKKSRCLGLIKCFSENKSLSNADIKDFLTFIQTVSYGGNIYESYIKTRIIIQGNQKTKSSMTLPPDLYFPVHVILRVRYQCYYYFHYLLEKVLPIPFRNMGGYLILNLILLGKCGLMKISSHHCWQLNTKVEKDRK